MKRKVIQLAGRTVVLSLPQEWVKKYSIRKGDSLEVQASANQLVISTAFKSTASIVSLPTAGLNERSFRLAISGLHKAGYTEISLSPLNPLVLRTSQDMLKNLLLGFAVLEQTEKKCVLRTTGQDLAEQFQPSLRRAFLVTLSLADQSYEKMKNNQFRHLPELLELEQTNNQLTNFCERLLTSTGYTDTKQSCFLYVVVWNLEKIADDYKFICQRFYHSKKPFSPALLEIYAEINLFFHSYYTLFYTFSLEQLTFLSKEKERIEQMIHATPTATPEELLLLHYLFSILTKITDFSASFLALHFLH
ncbi:hypothetical protein HZB00_03985 [Candidatus Woesearchaeota archaeon]|nr:hypothetical protein [Candidatus Woesearchaeota archaeon]